MMSKMGFAEGWSKWMEACIFNSSMSVLLNGSPTEDFQVGKGLRQGDPLSPFLFFIAAEGLTGLMHKAVELGKFKEGWSWILFQEGYLTGNDAYDAAELLSLLNDYHPFDRKDNWRWIPEVSGQFSVRSTYQFLQQGTMMEDFCPNTIAALKKLWKNDLPSKVSIFGWRLLLDKLPTRAALQRKRIISNPHDLCFRSMEDASHIFLSCSFAQQ
ncbi:ribonuclease H, partial [Trifolium pratense]